MIKSPLRQIIGLVKKSHKPEIIYYPFVSEPEIINDSPFDLSKGNHSWEQQLKILADTQGVEVHTPDRARFKNVIGVLFFDNMFYHNLPALKKLHKKDLLRKTIYIDFEPPSGHAKKHEPKSLRYLSELFKAVVTYDDNLVNKNNFIKCNVANFYAKPTEKIDFSKKKFSVMVTNNVTTEKIILILNNWNNTDYYNVKNIKYHKKAIYHKRLEVIDYFFKNHPEELDLYGTGFPEAYNDFGKGFLDRSKKIKVMSGYKFAIAFDSYTNQNGYISEKIFDAFFAKVIPVYLGADNISEYIPNKCFVDMRNFSSHDDLYLYLKNMSQKEYENRIAAIEAFLKSEMFNKYFSSKGIAQILLKTIISPAFRNYDSSRAQKILNSLDVEKAELSKENVMTSRIEKEQIDGEWCFVISVKPAKNNPKIEKIYSVTKGKNFKVKTYDDRHPELKGNKCMVIPYEDIYRRKKIEYFIESGKNQKTSLVFSPHVQKIINKTDYDEGIVFYSTKNIIGCREYLS